MKALILAFIIPFVIPKPTWTFHGTVIDNHDGDTLTVELQIMDDLKKTEKLRLDGLDAPELDTPEGKTVQKIVEDLVKDKEVTVSYTKREKFGRLLAVVYIGTTNLNEYLLSNKYAKPYSGGRREP